MTENKHEEIKTMKLYEHLDRLERRLKAAGSAMPESSAVLDPELLASVDCLHYFGDEPVRAVQQLISRAAAQHGKQQENDVRVLDLGTGYGGTARLLAHRTRCHVDALELQPDLSMIAEEMTRRCGLSDRVTHVTGDFLQRPVAHEQYDVIVGLLSFMHIGQWRELFSRCFASLKPGGVLYVEDFFRRGASFSSEELRILREETYCADLLSREEMLKLLQDDIGFEAVQFDDVTDTWTPYLAARAKQFAAELDHHVQVDGEATAKSLNHFYQSVADVFSRGNLGGYKLVVRRPQSVQP
ncbi:hypothetical protein ATCC90586_004606 [Pythium insidiosum]|nr:hypothetical protein ATCC90586_004606 [Pythium insidiosum]